MELYRDSDGPSLDPGITARLKTLDPNLRVTFSRWAVDPFTTKPILAWHGKPVLSPAWHLWLWSPRESRYFHLNTFPLARGGFTHRNVAALEADCGRKMRPSDVLRMLRERQQDAMEAGKRKEQERRKDVLGANEKRIHDLLFEGKRGVRQAKAVSYAGQQCRVTPGEIEMDSREAGWEGVE